MTVSQSHKTPWGGFPFVSIFLLFCVAVGLLALLIIFKGMRLISSATLHSKSMQRQQFPTLSDKPTLAPHPVTYWDERLFYQGILATEKKSQNLPTESNSFVAPAIRALVLPHHLVASHLLADGLARLQTQEPKRLIILTPDHYQLTGNALATSSTRSWDTVFGQLDSSVADISELEKRGVLLNNQDYNKEHAISGITPYIKHYLPNTSVIPLTLKATLNLEQVQMMANVVCPMLDQDTVLVGSIDFAHDLPVHEATKHDAEVLTYIHNGDYKSLLGLGNEYLDGPEALAVLMMCMSEETAQPTLIDQTHSTELLDSPVGLGVSHLEVVWR